MPEESSTDAISSFDQLNLSDKTLRTLKKIGFVTPSKIQAAFIPVAMTGVDCSGQARTGTGKTAAFTLPMLERLDFDNLNLQGIVLTPTRELCEQVASEFSRLSDNRCVSAAIVGGHSMDKQIRALRRGVHVVIGTPGRVIDLMNRGELKLDNISVAILDEADRMLDIGFRPDIERILKKCPSERQTLLLSATMPPEVEKLSAKFMRNPERVDMSEDALVATEMIDQYYVTVDADRKLPALVQVLMQEKPKQAIVFTRTKRGADQLYAKFRKNLDAVSLIHGDLPQNKRTRVLKNFREGKIRLLIATDVVGRGIDVSGISHIINYDIPEFCDDYVHRIGRTGRLSSDRKGCAITFATLDQGDQLTKIEMRVNKLLPSYVIKNFEATRGRSKPVSHVNDPQPVKKQSRGGSSSVYSHA
ncbi:DEAD/DEAH box helicase [Calycomorphotria hydatis]|uniref:DEAD-box ATP-dependent RNA helicase CshA n=1 Tax=Calycomorphotria hydatis TaxID=2528027 RepID=A0A517T9D2_9PLAN|nr:DEAD/DEAH box helicase [Calycomorphotria hydatis]QDT64977.1 DEAD-box ATP-dependent RNA helicase CshA [Calycomorphotria hydatis]